MDSINSRAETGGAGRSPDPYKETFFPVPPLIIYMVLAKIIKQLKSWPPLILFFGSAPE
jgi:hypothetical protein